MISQAQRQTLEDIQQRVLWLSTNMIHHANHLRPNPDKTKVGGHQASSASMVTIMTALYFHYLNHGDLVSVKPHASPVFHAIQYLLGQISRDYLPGCAPLAACRRILAAPKTTTTLTFRLDQLGWGRLRQFLPR